MPIFSKTIKRRIRASNLYRPIWSVYKYFGSIITIFLRSRLGHLTFSRFLADPEIVASGKRSSNISSEKLCLKKIRNVSFVKGSLCGYDSSNRQLEQTRFRDRVGDFSLEPRSITAGHAECIYENAIFAGVWFGAHYGHLLIDSCSRLWPMIIGEKNIPKTIIFTVPGSMEKSANCELGEVILTALRKTGSSVIFVRGRVLVRELFIPDRTCIDHYMMHSRHREVISCLVQHQHDPKFPSIYPLKNKDVYISRARLPAHCRTVVYERELEKLLKQSGFKIIYPEELTLSWQIAIFSSARNIVGFMGSAFHSVLLTETCTKPNMVILHSGSISANYINTDEVCGIQPVYIKVADTHPFSVKQGSSDKDLYINPLAVSKKILSLTK